jgi:hypothetical protein
MDRAFAKRLLIAVAAPVAAVEAFDGVCFFRWLHALLPTGSPEGRDAVQNAIIHAGVFLTIASLAVTFFGLILMLVAKTRKNAFYALIAGLVMTLEIFGGPNLGLRLAERAKHRAYLRCPNHAKPLIVAIRAFEKDHGKPPRRLEDLTPKYIATLPQTGIGAYPDYEYHDHESGLVSDYSGNAWMLVVPLCPLGEFDEEDLLYLPNQDYDKQFSAKGKFHIEERVGDWVHVSAHMTLDDISDSFEREQWEEINSIGMRLARCVRSFKPLAVSRVFPCRPVSILDLLALGG